MREWVAFGAIFFLLSNFAAILSAEGMAEREMRIEVNELRHRVKNFTLEVKLLEEKFYKQQKILNELKEKFSTKTSKENGVETRQISTLQQQLDALAEDQKNMRDDLRLLRSHANESSTALSKFRKQIGKVEGRFDSLEGRVDLKLKSLKGNIESLVALMEGGSASGKKTYRVKEGDSLARIAKKHQTTVDELKSENHLKSDLIMIGQELIIP